MSSASIARAERMGVSDHARRVSLFRPPFVKGHPHRAAWMRGWIAAQEHADLIALGSRGNRAQRAARGNL